MGKKLILTEQQYNLIINQILKETVNKLDKLEIKSSLDEGFWDTVKYGLSKLGRYKAGGKIMGKGKIDVEYKEKIRKIIAKEGNDMIKELDDDIQKTNPEFPNNKDPQLFLETVMKIAAIYDSIVAATKKQPKEKGYMPIDAANGIINDLREYTKKFLDIDLRAIYSGFNEAEDITGENLMSEEYQISEDKMCEIDKVFGLNEYGEDSGGQDMTWGRYKHDTNLGSSIDQRMMSPFNVAIEVEDTLPKSYIENDVESAVEKYINFSQINREVANKYMSKDDWWEDLYYNIDDIRRKREEERGKLNEADPLNADDVRAGLQAKRGAGDDFASTRMDTLKSNKLPLILAGTGAALGALGWIAQTDWFRTWLESLLGGSKVITNTNTIVKDVVSGPDDGEGFVSWSSKIMGKDIKTGADLQQFINKFGAENVSHMFDGNGGGDSMGQVQKLQELIKANPNASMGDIFNKADQTFGSMSGGQNLFGVSKAATFFARIVVKQLTKTVVKGAGTVLAGKLAGLGAIASGVGIALLTTGVLVKLVRMKGQKSSRAATLNTLYQSMRNLEGGVGIIEPTGDNEKAKTKDGGTRKGVVTTGDNEKAKTKDGGTRITKQRTPRNSDNNANDTMNDDLYNSLRNLFLFIVNSEKKFGAGPKNSLSSNLSEAKYFRDKALVNFLNKNVSQSRVVEFENLLNRVEQLRNKIRNLKPTGDKVFDQFLDKFKQNPIMVTDFNKMFNIVTVNQQAYKNMANFINDIFKTIYTGRYKQSNLIDKLRGIGKMNEADINADRTQFEKNAQDRKKFKKHLLQFLDDSISLFQYMVKLRKQIAASGKQTKTKQPKQNVSAAPRKKTPSQTNIEPQPDDKGQYSMDLNENPKLMEELKRIKKLMLIF